MKPDKKHTEELLSCPFCGATAAIQTTDPTFPGSDWLISCPNGHQATNSTRDFAIKSWNQRFSRARSLIKYPVLYRDLKFAGALIVALFLISFFLILAGLLIYLSGDIDEIFPPDHEALIGLVPSVLLFLG